MTPTNLTYFMKRKAGNNAFTTEKVAEQAAQQQNIEIGRNNVEPPNKLLKNKTPIVFSFKYRLVCSGNKCFLCRS